MTSILQKVKAARDKAAAGRTERFDLPPMEGLPKLMLGVRSIPAQRFAEVSGGEGARAAAVFIAAFAEHGDGIIVRDPELGDVTFARWALDTCPEEERADVEGLITWDPDDPTTLDRFAAILDLGTASAADVVLWLMPPDNDLGPLPLARDIDMWASENSRLVSRLVMGE